METFISSSHLKKATVVLLLVIGMTMMTYVAASPQSENYWKPETLIDEEWQPLKAWLAAELKELGGNGEETAHGTDPPSSELSQEILVFGEEVVSPSSSKQRKLGDLRSRVKQIREQDNLESSSIKDKDSDQSFSLSGAAIIPVPISITTAMGISFSVFSLFLITTMTLV